MSEEKNTAGSLLEENFTGELTNPHKLDEFFDLNPEAVRNYKSAKEYYYWTETKPTLAFIASYLGALFLAIIFEFFTVPTGIETKIYAIGGALAGLILVLLLVFKYATNRKVKSEDITEESFIYYQLVMVVREFEAENYKESRSRLVDLKEFLLKSDEQAFDRIFSSQLKDYIKRVENEEINFFKETFSEIKPRIKHYLVSITGSFLNKAYSPDESSKIGQKQGPIKIAKGGLATVINDRKIKIVLPYVFVLTISAIIWTFNQSIAQIVAVVFIGMLTKYYNPDIEDN
jgi:hypothetical protein